MFLALARDFGKSNLAAFVNTAEVFNMYANISVLKPNENIFLCLILNNRIPKKCQSLAEVIILGTVAKVLEMGIF